MQSVGASACSVPDVSKVEGSFSIWRALTAVFLLDYVVWDGMGRDVLWIVSLVGVVR